MKTTSFKPILLLIILTILCAFCNAQATLRTNGRLVNDQSLSIGVYRLTMQRDCNLVLYDRGRAIWSTNTANIGFGCRVVMQNDGNLVVYLPNNTPVWNSNTPRGRADYYLALQSDRNLVIYAPGGTPIWNTNTQVRAESMPKNTKSTNDKVTKHA